MDIRDTALGRPKRTSLLTTRAHIQPFYRGYPAPWLDLLETFLKLLRGWSHVAAQEDEEGCKHKCFVQLVYGLQVDMLLVVLDGKAGSQAIDWNHEDDADIPVVGHNKSSHSTTSPVVVCTYCFCSRGLL